MLEKPKECRDCDLETAGTGFSVPEGRCTNGVLLVGEALGREEAIDGLPFRPQAEAGSMLERVLKLAGVERPSLGLWNILGCQPPKNWLEGAPYEISAINHCRVHFDRVVDRFKPRCIVALGNVPFRTLTGVSGEKRGIMQSRGYVYESKYGPVVAGLHPSFIRRGKQNYAITLVHDIRKAVNVALGTFTNYEFHPGYKRPKYIEYPGLDEARSFLYRVRDNARLPLAYDLETLTSQDLEEDEYDEIEENEITQVQFSLEPRTGICFPWEGEYIKLAREILGCENDKYGHNVWEFDNPILKAQAQIVPKGVIHDTMYMWHHAWPDLDKGLQKVVSMLAFPFPWKHLSTVRGKKAWYGIADVDACQYIVHILPQQMKEKGIWRGYEKQVLGLYPCLSHASERGIRVDNQAREEFATAVKEVIRTENIKLQGLVPNELKRVDPPEGYKKTPVWLKEAIYKYDKAAQKWRQVKGKDPESLEHYLYRKYSVVKRTYQVETPPLFLEMESAVGFEQRWTVQLPFKTSKDQIVDYIKAKIAEGKRGYYVPLTFKEEKETTGKDELKRLAYATDDPVFFSIINLREHSKILSTDVKNWAPGEDGKVHTTFGYGPATGQLSSRRPNAQNVPKHAELAKKFRQIIVASPGCALVECDFSGFHARMLGRETQDKSYYHLAGIDIHSFLASYLKQVNQPVPLEVHRLDDPSYRAELALRLGYIKKHFQSVRDEIAKRTILGWGFGMGPMKAYHLYRESFGTLKVAQDTFKMLERLFPVAAEGRNKLRKKAHFQTYLLSNWGYIRYFFEVFRYARSKRSGKWELAPGADSEAAIAFLPANHAFGMIKSVMIRLENRGAMEKYRFVNTVHDSLVFDCPLELVQECIKEVYELMTRPCKTLADPVICPDGFQVGVGVSVGENWSKSSMKEFKANDTMDIVSGNRDWRDIWNVLVRAGGS